jgi:hypothetical protein
MLIAACSSSPTSPSGGSTTTPSPASTVVRGSITGDPAVLSSGLRLVSDDGANVTIDQRGQFNGAFANRPRSLRLVSPGIDAAVTITSGDAVVAVLELTLELRGSSVVTLLVCTTTVSTPSGSTSTIELRACLSGPS